MSQNNNCYDCLVVGGGFAGIHQLYHLRKIGLSVKLLEAGGDLGGTWYWNTYPGARVDSELPIYQFSDPELWKDWTFSERFPGWKELQEYFKYVDNKYDIKRDAFFNSRVVSAVWDNSISRWTVTTEDNRVFQTQFLSLCTGLTSKYHIPNFAGIESFKGQMHHTARWPTGCDFKGKRVGVIGTGASAVQIIQEIASEVGHLTVFQRTSNLALPMRQEKFLAAQEQKKDLWPTVFDQCYQTFAAFPHDVDPKPSFSVPPEERIMVYEERWAKGSFEFWLGNYADIFTNQKANDEVYAFWRKKTLERISHLPLEAQEKLAPEEAPHPFGVKRPCLEQGYFEIFSQDNVDLVDINKNTIQMITPNGVKTNDGVEHELDILVLATGYDAMTGGITKIDIRGQDGISIKEKWETDGVRSYLGLAAATYPNMFWIFGPQSAFGNGPSVIEYMSKWIVNCIKYMKENNFSSIVTMEEAQDAYTNTVDKLGAAALWTKAAHSWYLGTNIEGKRNQMLWYTGGFPAYDKLCNDSVKKGYQGFNLKYSD